MEEKINEHQERIAEFIQSVEQKEKKEGKRVKKAQGTHEISSSGLIFAL